MYDKMTIIQVMSFPEIKMYQVAENRTIIEPKKGWIAFDLKEVWKYRELFYFLTKRDIKVRYKQTVLGSLWAVIQPVITMLVFTLFFGRLADGPFQELTHCPQDRYGRSEDNGEQ